MKIKLLKKMYRDYLELGRSLLYKDLNFERFFENFAQYRDEMLDYMRVGYSYPEARYNLIRKLRHASKPVNCNNTFDCHI